MRPLRVSLVLAAATLQWACGVDEARTETAAAHSRDSALTHDLVLAGYDSAVVAQRRDSSARTTSTRTVTMSGGDLATSDSAFASRNAALNTSAAPAPSAEGYIGPSCASPAADDQRRCLMGYLARSDAQLDRSYQALITRLKEESGTRAGANDPAVVRRLRATQRNWLTYRDEECRQRLAASEGPLWAPGRAKCLASYSALREKELNDALTQRKPSVKAAAPTKPKVTKQTKRSKSRRRGRH
jgi:uncharacterized protein YecT (DUF1311 family)